MKNIKNILVYLLSKICCYCLVISPSFANTTNDSITKANYQQAYDHLNNMLEGKTRLRLEDAIFTIENAYADNQLSKTEFTNNLNFHTKRILQLAEANKDKLSQNIPKSANTLTPLPLGKGLGDGLLLNWAIYTYMTDTTYWKEGNNYIPNHPMVYNKEDPYGTNNWESTFVTTLLDPAQKTGNCFSLAVLYKIFSDRLQSEAYLSTAPQHIYIQHKGFDDNFYNIELTTRTFPGSGTIKTYTYTTHDAVTNGIALRRLNEKEEIALCLVYLAKGLEKKLRIMNYELRMEDAAFSLQCAETALKYDSLSLNALLLKAQALEKQLRGKNEELRMENNYENYRSLEATLFNLYELGYRQMPQGMQENLLAHNQGTLPFSSGEKSLSRPFGGRLGDEGFLSYYTLSENTFPEIIPSANLISMGNSTIDIQAHSIYNINTNNNTNITDPIAFALSIDPLAAQFPDKSPYNAMGNNPINMIDPDGKKAWTTQAVVYREGDEVPTTVNTLHFTGVMVNLSSNGAGSEAMARRALKLQENLTDGINNSGANGNIYTPDGELIAKEEYVADINIRVVTSIAEVQASDHVIYLVDEAKSNGKQIGGYVNAIGGKNMYMSESSRLRNGLRAQSEEHEWGHLMSLIHTHIESPDGYSDPDADEDNHEVMSDARVRDYRVHPFTPDQVLQMFDFAERSGANPNGSYNATHSTVTNPEKDAEFMSGFNR